MKPHLRDMKILLDVNADFLWVHILEGLVILSLNPMGSPINLRIEAKIQHAKNRCVESPLTT